MHDIVVEQFESHLSGNASQAFYDHLDGCAPCREDVVSLAEISGFVQALKPVADTIPEPSWGFYNRVSARIVESQQKQAWGLFSPGIVFFRRIAFASLLVLATLGGFLVSHEDSADGADAVAIMAQQRDTATDQSAADQPADAIRDRLLVTLASYHD